MRKAGGFSLIELLIVVAIILIIAAIAIPNLLRARITANEASAVSSIRTIVSAEATYHFCSQFSRIRRKMGSSSASNTVFGTDKTGEPLGSGRGPGERILIEQLRRVLSRPDSGFLFPQPRFGRQQAQ